MMKKMAALMVAVMMVLTGIVCAAGAEEALTFRNGIRFGMNMDEVITAENIGRYEIDDDDDNRGLFWELEYENVTENNARADLKYLFVGNELVAIRVDFADHAIAYDQLKADLTAKYGSAGSVDLALLGNGIRAVDDDGFLEGQAEAIVNGNLMIVLEKDWDDVKVTYVDLSAAYIH